MKAGGRSGKCSSLKGSPYNTQGFSKQEKKPKNNQNSRLTMGDIVRKVPMGTAKK